MSFRHGRKDKINIMVEGIYCLCVIVEGIKECHGRRDLVSCVRLEGI